MGRRLAAIYRFHFQSERRERLFLASIGFLVTFGGSSRAATASTP